jgi:hypothetical protein
LPAAGELGTYLIATYIDSEAAAHIRKRPIHAAASLLQVKLQFVNTCRTQAIGISADN